MMIKSNHQSNSLKKADGAKGCSCVKDNFQFTYFLNLSCYVVLYSVIHLLSM